MDGRAVLSCTMLAAECEGKAIQTIEGIAANPKWKPLIDAYCRWDAMQCGYCTPGFLVSAKALLDKNPTPPRTISARRLPETSASAALIRVTLQQFWKLR
jgi:aerobic-type carbon monoxide dehydrogenase small subunit (CoxS/CutS family)